MTSKDLTFYNRDNCNITIILTNQERIDAFRATTKVINDRLHVRALDVRTERKQELIIPFNQIKLILTEEI